MDPNAKKKFDEKFASKKKQVRSALERIEALEATINNFALAVDGIMKQYRQRIGALEEALDAVVGLVGKEAVEKAIEAARITAATEEAETAQKALEVEIAEGRATKTDKVGENSLIVGNETKADGTVIPPGRMQMRFDALQPKFRQQLLGQGVGFQVNPTPGGGIFTVEEIYDLKTPEQLDAEAKAKALEAVADAAAEEAKPAPESADTVATSTDVPAQG